MQFFSLFYIVYMEKLKSVMVLCVKRILSATDPGHKFWLPLSLSPNAVHGNW